MSSDSALTIVPLGTSYLYGPLISHELYTLIMERQKDEKIILFFNRRGYGRAWICHDCGYFALCSHCDIALAYHTRPSRQLVCHQCGYRELICEKCPTCHGVRFDAVGTGIQEIESHLIALLEDRSVLRIDSDIDEKRSTLTRAIENHDIILTTYGSLGLIHQPGITHAVILHFDSDLTLPDYRMEEELYHTIHYIRKSGKDLMIQTYTPEHPLLLLLESGNYRDFLMYTSAERERYGYPPYQDYACIRIHAEHRNKVIDMMKKMISKIEGLKSADTVLLYDREVTDRVMGEWSAKITLKGQNIASLVSHFEVEILRNGSVTLEWR